MNFMDLVKLVVSGEQWEQRQHFKKDAANTPVIHLVIVVTIRHETFWRTVPASTDILGERWLRVDTTTRTKIS